MALLPQNAAARPKSRAHSSCSKLPGTCAHVPKVRHPRLAPRQTRYRMAPSCAVGSSAGDATASDVVIVGAGAFPPATTWQLVADLAKLREVLMLAGPVLGNSHGFPSASGPA